MIGEQQPAELLRAVLFSTHPARGESIVVEVSRNDLLRFLIPPLQSVLERLKGRILVTRRIFLHFFFFPKVLALDASNPLDAGMLQQRPAHAETASRPAAIRVTATALGRRAEQCRWRLRWRTETFLAVWLFGSLFLAIISPGIKKITLKEKLAYYYRETAISTICVYHVLEVTQFNRFFLPLTLSANNYCY